MSEVEYFTSSEPEIRSRSKFIFFEPELLMSEAELFPTVSEAEPI